MADRSPSRLTTRLRRLTGWAGFLLVVLGVVVGLATFAILTGLTPLKPTPQTTMLLLTVNGVVMAVMALMIIGQLIFLIAERRQGTPERDSISGWSRCSALMAIIPAILVAVFATVTLSRGLDTWFSERTRAIVDAAVNVAEAYLRDHAEATRGDVAAISADLSQQQGDVREGPPVLRPPGGAPCRVARLGRRLSVRPRVQAHRRQGHGQ